MTNPLAMLANPPHRYASQAPQWIGDWSSNVRSWLDAEGIDVLVLRYEDMVFDASATFGKAVEFLGFQISIEELADVLERCSFKELKEMEDVNGFGERNPKTSCFFRTGQTDSWKTSLTDRQREAIVESHGPMMTRLGYFE